MRLRNARVDIASFCIILVCYSQMAIAQTVAGVLQVQNFQSAEALIQKLVKGSCVNITNVQYKGLPIQAGTFSNGRTNVGFDDGIILSTGRITDAPGPNDDVGRGGSRFGLRTPDPDFLQIYRGIPIDTLQDLAVLSFDFVPTKTPVTFEYVFASEEYCEFVGTQYNDAFGFFVSGPGINGPYTNGAANYALIPFTRIPVTINTVNHQSNANFFVNNARESDPRCMDPSPSPALNTLQFDGFTRGLFVSIDVQPCQKYHIEIKIIDAGDSWYDSAVMLRGGSFDAGAAATADFVVNNQAGSAVDTVAESCGTAGLLISRVDNDVSQPLTVTYTVGGTATRGTDYSALPTSVIIPAGQRSVRVPVNILPDLLNEGLESITVRLTAPCSCTRLEEVLWIKDLPPPTVRIRSNSPPVCAQGSVNLGAEVQSGTAPFRYLWNTRDTTAVIQALVNGPSTFTVTVTDACGQSTVTATSIAVNPSPTLSLAISNALLCPGSEVALPVRLSGIGPFRLDYTLNNVPQTPITDIRTVDYNLIVRMAGTVQITALTDQNGCKSTATATATITASALTATATAQDVACAGGNNGTVRVQVQGGQMPYQYRWQNNANAAEQVGIGAGVYTVTVTDALNCSFTTQTAVGQPAPLQAQVVSTKQASCVQTNGGSADVSVVGGTGPYTYLWSNNNTTEDLSEVAPSQYTVTIRDRANCTTTLSVVIQGDVSQPVARVSTPPALTCAMGDVILDGSASSVGNEFLYQWIANPGNVVRGGNTLTPTVNRAGVYTLIITNRANGCTASIQVPVRANATLPSADAGPQQTLTCAVREVRLDGRASTQGAFIQFAWAAPNAGGIVSGGNTATPTVKSTGTYTVTVTNVENGCTQTDEVEVIADERPPTVSIGPANALTCTQKEITLTATGVAANGRIAYNWLTTDGNIQFGRAAAEAIVTEAGTYTVVVTDLQNGCTASRTVTVASNSSLPNVIIRPPALLTCTSNQVVLDASSSTTGGTHIFAWSTPAGVTFVSGESTLMPTVNQPGQYTLAITNTANNCVGRATVIVQRDAQVPLAKAGEPAVLTCAFPVRRLGDSTLVAAPDVTYTWTTPDGRIISGGNTPAPLVDRAGTYTLRVVNTRSTCSATATVQIAENKAIPQAVIDPATDLSCAQPAVRLNAERSSRGATYTYEWAASNGGTLTTGMNTLTPTVITSGTYTLLVTNIGNSCTATATVSVRGTVNLPTVVARAAGIITCQQSVVNLDGTGSAIGPRYIYRWTTPNGHIVSGQNALHAIADRPGQYSLTVEDTVSHCVATFTVEAQANVGQPIASAGPDRAVNCTSLPQLLDGTGSSQGPSFTYIWTATEGGNLVNGSNTTTPEINGPGTYQLVVTDTRNGCTASDVVVARRDGNEPTVTIAPATPLTCRTSSVTLVANGIGSTLTYAWNGPAGSLSSTLNTAVANASGQYTVTVTNTGNNCTATATITVLANNRQPAYNPTATAQLNCNRPALQIGDPNTTLPIGWTYRWEGPRIVSGGNGPRPVVDSTGTYQVTVTDSENGCTTTAQVSVQGDFTPPQANGGPVGRLTCNTRSITLQPQASTGPNYTYQWATSTGSFAGPTNILNAVVNGAGFYFLTVTDRNNGCIALARIQVIQDLAVPKADAGPSRTLTCNNRTVRLSAAPLGEPNKYQFAWTPPTPNSIVSGGNTLQPEVRSGGLYQLVVTDTTNQCSAISTVEVTVDTLPPKVDAGIGPLLTCRTPTARLQGQLATNGLINIEWRAALGGNIVTGGRTLRPEVNRAGLYTIQATNALNGCRATDTVTVREDRAAPQIRVLPPATLTCVIDTVTLQAMGDRGAPFVYQWSTRGGRLPMRFDSLHIRVDSAGWYRLTVENSRNGCRTTDSVRVQVDRVLPLADAGKDGNLTCRLNSLLLDGTGSSANGPYMYNWDSPDGRIEAGIQTLKPLITAPGKYFLTVRNTRNGCQATDHVDIGLDVEQPTLTLRPPALLTCKMSTVNLTGQGNASGGTLTYTWTTLDGFLSGPTNEITTQATASGTYTLTVRNERNDCTASQSLRVLADRALPQVEAGPNFTLTCDVERVRLQGFASSGLGFTYIWTTRNGEILLGSNTLVPLVREPGVYVLQVVNENNGCRNSDSTTVFRENNKPIDFEIDLKPPGCRDNDGRLTFKKIKGGIGPFLYSTDGGKSYTTDTTFANIVPGPLELWIQDANGCEDSMRLVVPAAQKPRLVLPPDRTIRFGDTTQIIGTIPGNYPLSMVDTIIWDKPGLLILPNFRFPNSLKPYTAPTRTTKYTATLVSKDGCRTLDDIVISVEGTVEIYVPNVISISGSSRYNNIFFISTNPRQVKRIKLLQIHERWGGMVFERRDFQPNDPGQGWRGELRGRELNPNVFVYKAEIETIDGRTLYYEGDITVVR